MVGKIHIFAAVMGSILAVCLAGAQTHVPPGLGAGFIQRGQESFSILVIPEDGLAPISTIHHVIEGA